MIANAHSWNNCQLYIGYTIAESSARRQQDARRHGDWTLPRNSMDVSCTVAGQSLDRAAIELREKPTPQKS